MTVIISDVNTIVMCYMDDMASSKNVPHLTRLSRRVYAATTVESLGMNLKQVSMLVALRDRGELPQITLCDMMKLTQNTVVTWLNELEDNGYVSRIRDPNDRRKHNVALTAKGDAALERAESELRRIEDDVLSGLSADERTQLRKLMAKALDAQ